MLAESMTLFRETLSKRRKRRGGSNLEGQS